MHCKKLTSTIGVLLVLAVIVILAGPARATFPGKNGRIAFINGPQALTLFIGDIFTVNPDGSDLKQLTSFGSSGIGAGCLNNAVAWSPDGRQLAFELCDTNAGFKGQLWLMNADGSNQHPVFSHPSAACDGMPSFSPDGTQIVFARFICGGQGVIYRVQTDGTGLTALTHFNPNPDVFDAEPVYSPDGQTIAFFSGTRGGVIGAVYLMNADGSNIRRLTPPDLEAFLPNWSPDGQKVAFSTRIVSGVLDEEIWVINADGTNPTRLTNNNSHWNGYHTGFHDFRPSWSPQGDAIVFERDAPDFSAFMVYIMNPDGSDQKLLLQRPGKKVTELPVTRGRTAALQAALRLLGPGFCPIWGPAPN
jgi:Tol biopolymer transport system component